MQIVCVHQGYELYGSDRCFVDSVRVIRSTFPTAIIHVLLPLNGPLSQVLQPLVDEVKIARLWVLRKRGIGRLLAMAVIAFPCAVVRSIISFRRSDLVYINTVTVLDYLIAARFFRNKALLHVHEAPEGLTGKAFGTIVRCVGVATIFNSESTRAAYKTSSQQCTYVVHNGIRKPVDCSECSYDGCRPLRLLMLGRLSYGKGQDILIDACSLLPGTIRAAIEVRIVGSSFGSQVAFEKALAQRARSAAGPATIRFEAFVEDPAPLFEWCDVVVVPSRVREGFGRVAAEAMAYGRAAMAAAHGGLTEIVGDRQTGWLFKPRDPAAHAVVITEAVQCPQRVRDFGLAGRALVERCFAAEVVDERLQRILYQRFERGAER